MACYGIYCSYCECIRSEEPCIDCIKAKCQCKGEYVCCAEYRKNNTLKIFSERKEKEEPIVHVLENNELEVKMQHLSIQKEREFHFLGPFACLPKLKNDSQCSSPTDIHTESLTEKGTVKKSEIETYETRCVTSLQNIDNNIWTENVTIKQNEIETEQTRYVTSLSNSGKSILTENQTVKENETQTDETRCVASLPNNGNSVWTENETVKRSEIKTKETCVKSLSNSSQSILTENETVEQNETDTDETRCVRCLSNNECFDYLSREENGLTIHISEDFGKDIISENEYWEQNEYLTDPRLPQMISLERFESNPGEESTARKCKPQQPYECDGCSCIPGHVSCKECVYWDFTCTYPMQAYRCRCCDDFENLLD